MPPKRLMGNFRGGRPVTGEAVTLVLATIDRIKALLDELERNQAEPEGNDRDLIARAPAHVRRRRGRQRRYRRIMPSPRPAHERPLRPGEYPAAEIEQALRAAREAQAGDAAPATSAEPSHRAAVPRAAAAPRARRSARIRQAGAGARDDDRPDGKVASQSIRVHVDTLEHLMTMVSELVLTRNQLIEIVRRHEDSEFKAPLQRLSNVTAELQEGVLKTRMQPIGNAWQKLPRIVRDLSAELDKPIELEMYGADTELDRQVLDLIKDPLTHMVRNSADHGLEMPAQRLAAGKPERGTIRLSACHEGGHIIIEISDDGRGLDTERIKAKVDRASVSPRKPRSTR